MTKQQDERFKCKNSMEVLVFYAMICLWIIVCMCTQKTGFFFVVNKDVEDEMKNQFLIDAVLSGFNLIPCRQEYHVYPNSELPDPNLPKIGRNNNQSSDEGDSDGNEEEPLRNPDFQNYNERLSSFSNWPHQHPSPQVLSNAGFYFKSGPPHTVRCHSCGISLHDFGPDTDPLNFHANQSPNCQYLHRRIESDMLAGRTSLRLPVLLERQRKESRTNSRIKTPQFKSLQARLDSYGKWPIPHCQNPRALAKAGFYYTGDGDLVKCFHCGGGLHDWEHVDVPWVEHCQWFPDCPYANDMRGPANIGAIPEENRLNDDVATNLNDPSNYVDIHQSMRQTNAQPEEERNMDAIAEENEKLKRKVTCVICRNEDIHIMTLPCGHFVLCMTCAEDCEDCPICNKEIKVKQKVYRS